MKMKNIELDVDVIGTQKGITATEEEQIRNFLKKSNCKSKINPKRDKKIKRRNKE